MLQFICLIIVLSAGFLPASSHAITAEKCQSNYDAKITETQNPNIYSPLNAVKEADFSLHICMNKAAQEKEYEKNKPSGYNRISMKKGGGVNIIHITEEEYAAELEEKKVKAKEKADFEKDEFYRNQIKWNERNLLIQKEMEAQQLADLNKSKKDAEIKASPKYRRTEALRQIEYGNQTIKDCYAAIEEENRIGRISGYVNSRRLHDLGALILNTEKINSMQKKIIQDIDSGK